ncbi:hypothetical protein ACFL04_03775 [Patescibacteria group bacterium]
MNKITSKLVPSRVTGGVLLFVLVAFILLLWPNQTAALNIGEKITEGISGLLLAIVGFLGKLLVQIVNILISVAKYNGFADAPAIEKGWVIIRDMSNMFFIIVLLIIAFATILKIENYRYNRLLGRLIIMAVLVNFSRMIAGLFIDFTQVIMLTFVSAFKDVAAGNIADGLGLTELLRLRESSGSVSSGEVLTALILAVAMLLIALIVVGINVIVLIMRVLALWLLVILSPFAYLFRTFPATERYAQRWWTEFGKYATTGPVLAFFLWLTFSLMSLNASTQPFVGTGSGQFESVDTSEQAQTVNINTSSVTLEGKLSSTISTASESDNILSFIIAISLLVGSLVVTSQLGVAGGKLAGAAADRVRRVTGRGAALLAAGAVGGAAGVGLVAAGKRAVTYPLRALRGTTSYLEHKLYENTGVGLRPSRYKTQIAETFARRKRDSEIRGAGIAGERLEKGGIKGFVGGMVGAPRDFSEAYMRGFLGWKGAKAAYKTIKRPKGWKDDIDEELLTEQVNLEDSKKNMHAFTEEEKDDMREKRDGIQGDLSGLEKFINAESNELDIRGMGREMKLQLGGMLVHQLKLLGQQISAAKKEERRGIDEKGKPMSEEAKRKLREQYQSLETEEKYIRDNFQEVIDNFEETEKTRVEVHEAQSSGDKAAEASAKLKLKNLEDNVVSNLPNTLSLEPKWSFTEDWREDLSAQHKRMQIEVEDLDKNLAAPTVTVEDKNQRRLNLRSSQDRIRKLKEEQIEKAGPEAFYALRDRRLLQREEMNKLDTTNEDELIYMFKNAMKQDDKIKAGAVILQAAKVGHLNEILNASQYEQDVRYTEDEKKVGYRDRDKGQFFDSNQQGMQNFFRQIMRDKLGMEDKESLSLQNDVSNIAESIHHWAMGQSVAVENGQYRSRTPLEQGMRATVEMAKRDPEQVIRQSNRLGYGGETVDPDTGQRYHTIGVQGLTLLGHNWQNIQNNFARGRYNKSAASHLVTPLNMRILREMAKTMDNSIVQQFAYGRMTEQRAFSRFLDDLTIYAKQSYDKLGEEIGEVGEALRRGTM